MNREHVVRMGSAGRFVIPAKLRKAIGVKSGDPIIVRLAEEGLLLTTPELAIRAAQALVREHVSRDRRLADELIEERRREAERE